ncbi:MAG TPA: DUF4838 domain-containing protein [Opitutales bacterium]|nr:DUF4838 domain-containing protein [Opitutales bacterium]
MKNVSGVLFAVAAVAAAAGEFPVCTQRVEAVFADAAAAARAEARPAEVPEGKDFLFSCRWDDANARHKAMADVLDPLGVKATFYFNGRCEGAPAELARELVRRGHSIGSHTVTHDWMSRLNSVAAFREILENRILLEIASQSPVTTFTLPYSTAGTRVEPLAEKRVGRAAANAGLLGGPEGDPDKGTGYGLTRARWFSALLFRANDKDPDPKLFFPGFAGATNRVAKGGVPCGPHVTLGVHTWQSDEGLTRLASMLKESVVRENVWHGNENECVAFRFQALNSTVRRVSAEGKRAVFEVVRPEPYAIGAEVPFALAFSEKPVSVSPFAPRGMPAKYVRLDGGLEADHLFGKFTAEFENTTDGELHDLEFFLRLPPGYEPGVVRASRLRLAAGEKTTVVFKVRRPANPDEDEGDLFAALQTDAVGADGARIRFWQTFDRPRPFLFAPVPRDCCRFLGPLPASSAPDDAALAAASVPGAELKDVSGVRFGVWMRAAREKKFASYAVNAHLPGKWPETVKYVDGDKTEKVQILAFDFTADLRHGGEWNILFEAVRLGFGKQRAAFFLNGVPFDPSKPFAPRAGINRLLVRVPSWHGDLMLSQISIRSAADGASAAFLVPEAWKIEAPPAAKPHETKAADELSNHLAKRVKGTLTVAGRDAVVFHVGDTEFAKAKGLGSDKFAADEWAVKSFGGDVVLTGGGTHGALYATWHFLEDVCGVRWWSQVETQMPPAAPLALGKLDLSGKPAFPYRDVYTGIHDAGKLINGARHRLNGVEGKFTPGELALGGGFAYGSPNDCHTFDLYLPAKEHFKDHPEWYSYVKHLGQRVGGGEDGQLCLVNREVRERMKAKLREYVRADREAAAAAGVPPPYVYDVSENDSWNYCSCEGCEAAKAKWGMSGLMLDFVNDVATAVKDYWPEVLVNTFAYHGTEAPPKGGKKAADNVMVRVCDTKTNQAASHFEKGNTLFSDFLAAWAKAAKHISVWDYAITYTPELTGLPFPSEFHYAELFRYARGKGVFGFFWEQESPHKADMWELKYHLKTKLMENPDLDADKLIRDFMGEYYGAAGEKVAAYRKLLDKARHANAGRVGWFPELKDFDWIDAKTLAEGQKLFDEAEAFAKGNAAVFPRVRHARAGLDRLVCLRSQRCGRMDAAETRAARKRLEESWPDWMRRFPNVTEKTVERELRFAFGPPPPEKFEGRTLSDFPGLFFTCTDAPPRTIYFMDNPKAWRCDVKADETRARPSAVSLRDASGGEVFSAAFPTPPEKPELRWHKLGTAALPKGGVLLLRPDGKLKLTFEHRPELCGKTWEFWVSAQFTGKGFEPESKDPGRIWIERVALVEPGKEH